MGARRDITGGGVAGSMYTEEMDSIFQASVRVKKSCEPLLSAMVVVFVVGWTACSS